MTNDKNDDVKLLFTAPDLLTTERAESITPSDIEDYVKNEWLQHVRDTDPSFAELAELPQDFQLRADGRVNVTMEEEWTVVVDMVGDTTPREFSELGILPTYFIRSESTIHMNVTRYVDWYIEGSFLYSFTKAFMALTQAKRTGEMVEVFTTSQDGLSVGDTVRLFDAKNSPRRAVQVKATSLEPNPFTLFESNGLLNFDAIGHNTDLRVVSA